MILINQPDLTALLAAFPIPGFNADNSIHCSSLHTNSVLPIGAIGGILPAIPPFEKHPYLTHLLPNPAISGIMVGTFPPISYLCDMFALPFLAFGQQIIHPPKFSYYHGNVASFWNACPIGFNIINLQPRHMRPMLIEQALSLHGLIYTDIIKYCQRKSDIKYSYEDKDLNNIVIHTDIYDYLFNSESVNRIYFANSSFFNSSGTLLKINGNYSLSKRDAFQLFLKGAQDTGHTIDFCLPLAGAPWININEGLRLAVIRRSINNTLKTKVHIRLRLKKNNIEKVFDVVSCLSPAAHGQVQHNACVQNFAAINHPLIGHNPAISLLRDVLLNFFANNLPLITQYNV